MCSAISVWISPLGYLDARLGLEPRFPRSERVFLPLEDRAIIHLYLHVIENANETWY
jgi:hypothetical protein